jgi:putative transposase
MVKSLAFIQRTVPCATDQPGSSTSAANNLKSVSSRMLRKWNGDELARHYRQPVLWSRSYFISSVGGANLETVKAYIEGQARPR